MIFYGFQGLIYLKHMEHQYYYLSIIKDEEGNKRLSKEGWGSIHDDDVTLQAQQAGIDSANPQERLGNLIKYWNNLPVSDGLQWVYSLREFNQDEILEHLKKD